MEIIREEELFKNCLIRSILTFEQYLGSITGSVREPISYRSLSTEDLIMLLEQTKAEFFRTLGEQGILQSIEGEEQVCENDYDHIWKRVTEWQKGHDVISSGGHPESEYGYASYYREAEHQCLRCKQRKLLRKYI